jgi:hypothetical protein
MAQAVTFRAFGAGTLSRKDKYFMNAPINMHAARMALNNDPELRQWVEAWLKSKERAVETTMTDEEFDKHWLYVRPERMHEGAIEALTAYNERSN